MTPWSVGRRDRTAKPRLSGLTHVIDTGVPIEHVRGLLDVTAEYTDIWKFGFGTSFLDPTIDKKVQLLRDAGVLACVGGTLLEAAWLESSTDECLAWARDIGFPCLEVSDSLGRIGRAAKRELIERASGRFQVLAEAGSKDPSETMEPETWAHEMSEDLDAGASWLIAEGRQSGTAGLYSSDGSLRWNIVDSIVNAVPLDRVVFEAPQTHQQVAFIRAFGSNVSLGNIAPDGVLALEALRRGLRADTLGEGLTPGGDAS